MTHLDTPPLENMTASQERLRDETQTYRRVMQMLVVLAVTLLAVIAVAGWWVWFRLDRDAEAKQQVADIESSLRETRNDLGRVADGLDTLREQLMANNLEPVVPPSEELVQEQGAVVPEVNFATVVTAVEEYCAANNRCAGPTVTFAEVQAAVTEYCAAHNGCAGLRGETGATGEPGAQGAPGDSVTAEMVAAAVASYCSEHNDCIGPQGEPGPVGPAGPAGPSGSTECDEGYSEVEVMIPSEPTLTFRLCAAPRQIGV